MPEVALSALVGLEGGRIDRIVSLARGHLQMDVGYVAEFAGGTQVFRAVDGDSAGFRIVLGGVEEVTSRFDDLIVSDRIPGMMADSRNLSELHHMPGHTVGSYVAVPLVLSDGTVYGTFCCMSRQPRVLDDRDVQFLVMLTKLLVRELDEQHVLDQTSARIAGLISARAISIAFQPIIDVRDGRCWGVEALSRFPPGFGSPDTVFSTARTVGLGVELEVLAVEIATSMLPLVPASQYLAFNLTPEVAFLLASDPFLTTGVRLDRLVLEVTENMAMQGYEAFRERLAPLRERGLRLAIDDAGAGYASLYHIIELQPDIIKIDRSIVSGADRDHSRRSAIRAFVAIAADLDATVVAEGVETVAEMETIRELGVNAVQGYLLARPSTDTDKLAASRYRLPGMSFPGTDHPTASNSIDRRAS